MLSSIEFSKQNRYKIFVLKYYGKRVNVKPRYRWDDNTEMGHRKIGLRNV
jgi:hypothetical protein